MGHRNRRGATEKKGNLPQICPEGPDAEEAGRQTGKKQTGDWEEDVVRQRPRFGWGIWFEIETRVESASVIAKAIVVEIETRSGRWWLGRRW